MEQGPKFEQGWLRDRRDGEKKKKRRKVSFPSAKAHLIIYRWHSTISQFRPRTCVVVPPLFLSVTGLPPCTYSRLTPSCRPPGMKTDELISLLQSSIHLTSDERSESQNSTGPRPSAVLFGTSFRVRRWLCRSPVQSDEKRETNF